MSERGQTDTASNRAGREAEMLEFSFSNLVLRLDALAALLPVSAADLLGRLLNATRQHPLVGDGADPAVVAIADRHIAPHVKPSRRKAREVAERISGTAAARAGQSGPMSVLPEDSGRILGTALRQQLDDLSGFERDHLRELISNSLGGLSPTGMPPDGGWQHAGWRAGIFALSDPSVPPPVAERPAFLADDLVNALRMEAQIQSFLSVRMALRYVAPPARAARRFGASSELTRYVSDYIGHNVAAGNGFSRENATYLYYEDVGDGIQPHVDPFGISNALLMLRRIPPADGSAPSRLVMYTSDGQLIPIPLEQGQMVVLADGAIVHAREPLRRGEKVTLLSLVFAPLRADTGA
jgi:hypothetical protein